MPGLGTIINVALLVAGGLLGLAGGRFITPRIQDTLMKASGLCVLFIGLGGTMQKMLIIDGKALATTGTTMLIVSFALGSLIGEAVNLEAAIENLGEWLKRKTGSEGDNEFTNAFVSTSLTVCIGAMAIVGSIQDGLLGDWSTLALKGALDCIIVCTMTGLSIVMAGSYAKDLKGVAITTDAFRYGLPFPEKVSAFILMACLAVFAFTTILGWNYYSERCLAYLTGSNKTAAMLFRLLYVAAVFIGPYLTVEVVWNLADIFNGLMAIPNVTALIYLSGVVSSETKDYLKRLKAGKVPEDA